MSGANPPIRVQNTLHSLELNAHFSLPQRSTPQMHSLAHHHQHMHQRTHRHAFTPILHQSSTILPAPHLMGTQDSSFNVHLPRGTSRPSFAPITAFRTATQKSFSSPKGGRWAALHVSIAWKIYYNKQLKKVQQNPDSLYGALTPECRSGTTLPDSERRKESDQPSSTHPNPDFPYGNLGIRNEARKNTHRFNRSHPSDLYVSSSASCHNHTTTQREELEQPPNLHRREKPDEKEKHRVHKADTVEGSTLRDKPQDRTVSAELDVRRGGLLDRKRQLERDGFIQVKRVKKEKVDDKFDSSKSFHTEPSSFSMSHTRPSSHTTPAQHINISHLSLLYPNSSRCDGSTAPGRLLSYPGAETYPYQTASWELMWNIHKREDLHSRQSVLKENSLNTCKGQRQTEAFRGFFMPPLYFPLALGAQETAYLRGREFLHSRHNNCQVRHCRSQLPHPGFLATSC